MRTDNNYVRTFTGRHFWPVDPRPEDVCIEDIAHALSLTCRWNGHCTRHYSIAQHSCFVHDWVGRGDKLVGLLHDASEAYICDLAKPIKGLVAGYQEIERRLMDTIAQALGFTWPESPAVKDADVFALGAEMWHLFEPRRQYIAVGAAQQEIIEDLTLPTLTPKQAEEAFLRRYYALCPTS